MTNKLAICLSLLVLSASGCGNKSSVAPTPPPPQAFVPVPTVTVELEGRVLDEHSQPVEGARLRPTAWLRSRGPEPSATTDETGSFGLALDWPATWAPPLALRIDRDGYESVVAAVPAADATRPLVFNIYKSLTISPGESIQTTVSLRSYGYCGLEPLCRRVVVNAPSGKPVDIEVIPADGQAYAGLALEHQLDSYETNFLSRAKVPAGDDVWIVVRQPGRVSVVAAAER